MAAEYRVTEALIRQGGITPLYKYSHLFLAAKALAAMPLPKGDRVSFFAPSGAMLVCLTDHCLSLGLKVPDFTEPTRKFLQDISPSIVRMRNPVDIWFAAGLHGVEFAYREGMRAALKDPNIDAVAIPILLLTDERGVPSLQFIADLAREFPEKPIYAGKGNREGGGQADLRRVIAVASGKLCKAEKLGQRDFCIFKIGLNF